MGGRADRWVNPLLAAMGRGDLAAAGPLLDEALRHAPDDPRVQMVRADLPLMRGANLAGGAGPLEPDAGAILDQAYDAAAATLDDPRAPAPRRMAAVTMLLRLGDWSAVDRAGGFEAAGRAWARAGAHHMLLQQLPRVQTRADRLELLEQHRLAAAPMAAAAAKANLRRPQGPRPPGPLRVGFLSADLRAHAVGVFALPLFEHADPNRAALFCYSNFPGPADRVETFFRSRATFRDIARLADPAAAQLICDDRLDVLVDLGAWTGLNRLSVMAYRPAPLQASWMGYPHSTGLSAIDYAVLDPRLAPADPELLAEAAALLPYAWISLARINFSQPEPIDPTPPAVRSGAPTFGTANQPFKYSPQCLDAWAATLRATPGSTFLFVRPECASARFRANMAAAFSARGVEPARLRFDAVRRGHLARYNEIDVALDTFPLTGGTTTCESLWMGVPTVTMIGAAPYERLSWSLLSAAGLADLAATDEAGFAAAAAGLAGDTDRLSDLRLNLRSRIADGALGDGPGFARDFFDLMARLAQPRSEGSP